MKKRLSLYPTNQHPPNLKDHSCPTIQALLATAFPQYDPRVKWVQIPSSLPILPLTDTRIPTRLRPTPPPILRPRPHRHIKRTNRNRSQPRRLNTIFKIQIARLATPIPNIRHLISILIPIKNIPLHGTNDQIVARDAAPLRAIHGADAGEFGNSFVRAGEDWGRDVAGFEASGTTFGDLKRAGAALYVEEVVGLVVVADA